MLSGGGFAEALIRRKDRETPGVCPVLFFVPNDVFHGGPHRRSSLPRFGFGGRRRL